MHVLYAKDGYRCLLDDESKEVELLHNDKCLIGGSVFIPEVLDVINQHGLMEKLAIHACMFEGWLAAYAQWHSLRHDAFGIIPKQRLSFPHGMGKRLEVSYDQTTGFVAFDVVTPDVETNKWRSEKFFDVKLSALQKVAAFFS